MKCEIEIEVEDLAKELVNHIDMDDLARQVSGHIDTGELEICYEDLAREIDYSTLIQEIDYSDLGGEIDYSDLADSIMNDPSELVEKLSEKSTITELVNKAVEAKLEELAQAIVGKLEHTQQKDYAALKQAIVTALAAL